MDIYGGYTAKFWDEVRNVRPTIGFVSGVSAIFSFVLLVLYAVKERWRKTPGWLMKNAILCDFFSACSFFIFFKMGSEMAGHYHHTHVADEIAMWLMLACMLMAEMGANSWRLVMFLHLVVIYRNPFSPDRLAMVYPLVVGALTLFGAGVCLLCVRNSSGRGIHGTEYQSAIVFPVIVYPGFFVVASSMVQTGIWWAIRADRSGQTHASVSYKARERLTRHGFSYLSFHALQLSLGLTVLGLLIYNKWKTGWPWHAIVVLLCGRPLLSHFGWFMMERRSESWRKVFFMEGATPTHAATPARAEAEAAARSRELPPVSVQLADLGAASSAAEDGLPVAQHHSRRRLTAPGRTLCGDAAIRRPTGRKFSEGMPGPRIGENELMSELRFEVLYDVARSIGDNAQDMLRAETLRPRASGTTPLVQRRAAASWGVGTDPSREDSGTLDRGTLFATPSISSAGLLSARSPGAPKPVVTSLQPPGTPGSPSPRRGEQSPSRPGSSTAETHQGDDFAAIREAFDITPEQYARDFPNDLSRLTSRWVQKLKESVSEGASGSFFYRVLSDSARGVSSRFIVKEISRGEKNTLMSILPAYRRHVEERGGHSFIQYFGCYSVPLRWKYAARVHFVVMRNFLPVPMWLVFDLKGATINRRALDGDTLLGVQKEGGGAPQAKTNYGTLRDWEWMDIAMQVDVAPEDKVEIAEALRADADFLGRQCLLDYSLLLGIHRIPQETTSDPVRREEHITKLQKAGGYVSLDRHKVYFFGIIDVLEVSSMRWRFQHAVFATAFHLVLHGANADGITAMTPELYGDRFYTFALAEVLQMEDAFQLTSQEQREEERRGVLGACCGRRPLRGIERWGKLWTRRRRGLVRERMEAERVDFLRRISELEKEVDELRRREAHSSAPSSRSEESTTTPTTRSRAVRFST